jgi:hypothetical protein
MHENNAKVAVQHFSLLGNGMKDNEDKVVIAPSTHEIGATLHNDSDVYIRIADNTWIRKSICNY